LVGLQNIEVVPQAVVGVPGLKLGPISLQIEEPEEA
jgi:hypothetical protein